MFTSISQFLLGSLEHRLQAGLERMLQATRDSTKGAAAQPALVRHRRLPSEWADK